MYKKYSEPIDRLKTNLAGRLYRLELKSLKTQMLLNTCHAKYVIVSADKAPNNIVFVCISHYIDYLIKELGIDNSLGNPIYSPTTLAKEEILDNQVCFMFLWNFNQR